MNQMRMKKADFGLLLCSLLFVGGITTTVRGMDGGEAVSGRGIPIVRAVARVLFRSSNSLLKVVSTPPTVKSMIALTLIPIITVLGFWMYNKVCAKHRGMPTEQERCRQNEHEYRMMETEAHFSHQRRQWDLEEAMSRGRKHDWKA